MSTGNWLVHSCHGASQSVSDGGPTICLRYVRRARNVGSFGARHDVPQQTRPQGKRPHQSNQLSRCCMETFLSHIFLLYGPFCTQLRAVPVLMPKSKARENPSGHGPNKLRAAITDGRGISIDIARASEGEAKQARRERTSSSKGQDGRAAEGESRGACCPRGGLCGAGAAPCEQADEGGCFSAPLATNLNAKHRQVAASGINKLRVSSLLGLARGLEGSCCSAAAAVSWSPG